jgi:hypothetical protein
MATAKEARDWAHATLRGIGNSLYTPFCGTDGDDIDWDAYRTLVRYCVGELQHPMLWCTSGIAEFWSLTLDERKRAGAALRAARLGGERRGTARAAPAADQLRIVIGPGRDVGRERLLHDVILRCVWLGTKEL